MRASAVLIAHRLASGIKVRYKYQRIRNRAFALGSGFASPKNLI
jgi:hypothetical protein